MRPTWCPWCRDLADERGARVVRAHPRRGAGGCAVTPWDGGGWECSTCGARAPRQAWAQAQRWQAAADVMRERETARAAEAEAELARLRAVVAGRATPPSVEELAAHATAGGRWLYDYRGHVLSVIERADVARVEATGCRSGQITGSRWWALDASGNPCAWPALGGDRG